MRTRRWTTEDSNIEALTRQVAQAALPLENDSDLDPLLDMIGDARFVLLGEASHGTADYYVWRERISRRLIEEQGFSLIAVEGDWPDCYTVNRFIKGYPHSAADARDALQAFRRWPTWMWANEEIVSLVTWLREFNDARPAEQRVGFYGLDVYSLWDSLSSVLRYLEKTDGEALRAARRAFACFEPYEEDVQQYARATRWASRSCESQVVSLLTRLREHGRTYEGDGRDAFFNAEQNALVAKNAEHYYREMVHGGPESWNIRDTHMADTLDRLIRQHGPEAKAIIWEHNTHVGDARYTDMASGGMVNIGQLARERYEREGVVLVGFASHRGTVIAGDEWEAPMEEMRVPPAKRGSWEDVLHEAGEYDKLLLFQGQEVPDEFYDVRGHRAIGVVYHPEYEHYGNYVPTVMPRRYDALLYIDQSQALHPLPVPMEKEREVPETYPSAV